MNRQSFRRSYAAPPPPIGNVHSKFMRIVCRHEQLKVSFHQLNSGIRTGLLEAEDVFASLSLQLMNLVGLKTDQMAAERRYSTIVTSVVPPHPQEENCINKATKAGNELIERQKHQLKQLIILLRNIEAQVNSSQTRIIQNLADHQAIMKNFFLKAFSYVSSVHHSGQSNDLSRVMLKILKSTFNHVDSALGSVEAGIENLISELADKMCDPMVDYVNGLKVEMKNGICSRLFDVVKEMHEMSQARSLELEEARIQARLAQQSKDEVLSRLMRSEETVRKLTISLECLTEDTNHNQTWEKPSSMKEDKVKDDNLLWDLLQKKRKSLSDSPFQQNELPDGKTRSKKRPSRTPVPSCSHTPITCSQTKMQPRLQSSIIKSWTQLRSPTSATTQKVLRGKRATP